MYRPAKLGGVWIIQRKHESSWAKLYVSSCDQPLHPNYTFSLFLSFFQINTLFMCNGGVERDHLLLPVGAILLTSSFISARRVFSSFTANTGAHNAALSPLITGAQSRVSQSTLR
jgi:hypothetical protein